MLDEGDLGVDVAHWAHEAHEDVIAIARRDLQAFAGLHGMDEGGCRAMSLAVSEAVTNAVRHAYPAGTCGPITVDAATDGTHLTVRVSDRGTGQGDTSLGLGLPVMSALSDRVEFGPRRNGDGTSVVLEFTVRGAATAEAEPDALLA